MTVVKIGRRDSKCLDETRNAVCDEVMRRICSTLLILVCIITLVVLTGRACAAGPPRHIVLIVCDGLRPDSVTPDDMPTLYRLAHEGTFFAHHHPVYLSSTEVNGTAIATGAYPTHSGLMANNEYRPSVDLLKPFGTEELAAVRKMDELTGGRYLRMPTIAETVGKAGFRTVVAGTKGVALLHDRSRRPDADPTKDSVVVFQGLSLPDGLGHTLQQLKAFPRLADPTKAANQRQDAWTTHTLIDHLWAGNIPAFTTLWLSEPDFAQHGSGPGSEVARAALHSDDDNIGSVLKAIETSDARDSTDVLVVSDHGFSTIERIVNVVEELTRAGFDAMAGFTSDPKQDQVLVVPNGGSFSLYVIGHGRDLIAGLVDFLQKSDFAGVIFTRRGLEGTFTLDSAHLCTEDAPDILVSMRWNDHASATGMPGMLLSSTLKYGPGGGYHASLSRYDMHNTLIASGPDFKHGFVDELPTGNTDIAPTVLSILGIPPQKPMDGRVLFEAFADSGAPPPAIGTQTLRTSHQAWRQFLKVSRVGSTVYYDEGNADLSAAAREWSAHPTILQFETREDIYAIGDVHGDYGVMAKLLAAAKLVDSATASPQAIHWTGGRSVLVCPGDFIDKYNHSLDVIACLRSLQSQAQQAGGRIIITMGNHEAEFLAGKGGEKKGTRLIDELKAAGLSTAEVIAGRDKEGIGQFLRNLPIGAKVNDFFFCHAGNTHGLTLAQLDSELLHEVDRDGFAAPILADPDSMLEARMHPTPWWETAKSSSPEQTLRKNLDALGVKHLVFGHQPGKVEFADGTKRAKDEMFQKFDGLVFMIDTGMSRGQDSGRAALLKIHGGTEATAIYADGQTRKLWAAAPPR